MKKSTAFLLTNVCFLLGIVIGFLLSPAKKGFGNNSGNNTNYYYLDEKGKKAVVPKSAKLVLNKDKG